MPRSPADGCSAAANLQAALDLLRQLQRSGLRRLVLCPGSRSAPLAAAAGLLAGQGLDLFTGIDERSAAFLALGLGRADGHPAAVVTTSGTAVANLLPAVVEADSGAVPLLLLTADRPARLKHCGANQTVNQEQFLAASCRRVFEASGAGLATLSAAELQQLAVEAWTASLGHPAGPVHLNLPFEEPLHADGAALQAVASAPAAAAAMAPAALQDFASSPDDPGPALLDPTQPGLVVAGPWRRSARELETFAAALGRWQQRSGWPVLADVLSGLRGWPGLRTIESYDLLLAEGHGLAAPPQLLRLGPMPASRRLQQWIARGQGPQLLISEADPRNLDASGTATLRYGGGLVAWLSRQPECPPALSPSAASLALAEQWYALEASLQSQLDALLPPSGRPNEPALARALSRVLPPDLGVMLASSSPVRDWESFAAPFDRARPLFAFRGASGIDGTLSLAAGLAAACGALLLVCGDLALLHDANGWLWLEQLRRRGVRLCVLLIENGGGGIFEQLPIRVEEEPALLDFERLFAMPQTIDHTQLAAGYGVPSRRVQDLQSLEPALSWALQQPLALLELRTDRRGDAALRRSLRRRMAQLSAPC